MSRDFRFREAEEQTGKGGVAVYGVARKPRTGSVGPRKVGVVLPRAGSARNLRIPTWREGRGGSDQVSKRLEIHDVSKSMLDPNRIGGAATGEVGIGPGCGGNSVRSNWAPHWGQ